VFVVHGEGPGQEGGSDEEKTESRDRWSRVGRRNAETMTSGHAVGGRCSGMERLAPSTFGRISANRRAGALELWKYPNRARRFGRVVEVTRLHISVRPAGQLEGALLKKADGLKP